MLKVYSLLLAVIALFTVIESYKILIYNPKIGFSHVAFASQIADVLVDAGHEVVVATVDMDLDIKHKGANKARIYQIKSNAECIETLTKNPLKDMMWNMSDDAVSQFQMFKTFFHAQELTRSDIIKDKELAEFVLAEKFDFAYTEIFNLYMIAMFKHWNIPAYAVGTATCLAENHYSIFGVAFAPSYMPIMIAGSSDKMTYYERAKNLASFAFSKFFFTYNREMFTGEEEINAALGENVFSTEKDIAESSFIFLNSHPFLELPNAKAPKMIEVSGIGIPEPKPLDKYWLDILNLRTDTILISFGSLAKSSKMPTEMQRGIINAIKAMPDKTFIWKYETPNDGVIPKLDNLILSNWVPQNDLLNNEKLSLFVTHGGMNSITELAYRGIRTLCIPIFGDQMKNARLVSRAKIGIVMAKEDLIFGEKIKANILGVLENTEFKENAIRLSKMMNNRPISSKDLLVKHVEFAAQFKKLPMLDLESINQSFIVYYLLDIILPFVLLLLLFFYITFKVTSKILSCVFGSKSLKEKRD
uniref:UDP-glucuronosyltransferase n=1 Tax=Rhabditophanes sp. KR3021 TaxID=114890 RepID=A0AC35U0V0_9BILA